jgi:solute carrier family 6 amino acid transporter-like protein 5/7/9/14
MFVMNTLFYFRYTLVITISNVLTSIFAGFVIFAYLGYLAYITGQNVQDVVSEGKQVFFMYFLR